MMPIHVLTLVTVHMHCYLKLNIHNHEFTMITLPCLSIIYVLYNNIQWYFVLYNKCPNMAVLF